MDIYQIMKEIEKLKFSDKEQLSHWLQERVMDDLNNDMSKHMKNLKEYL